MSKSLQTKALIENIEGKLLAVASEEMADRDGDIITIDGWDLKNFKKNPVMLFLHNLTDRALPIGKAANIRIKEINGKRKLVFEPEFEEITELGQTVAEFFRQGFMNAFSVGFLPLEAEKISSPDEWPPRFKFIKQELLEISAVPVPALPTATIIDQSKSLGLNMKIVKSLVKDMDPTNQDDEEDAKPKEDEENQSDEEQTPTAVQPDSSGDGDTNNDVEASIGSENDEGSGQEDPTQLKEEPKIPANVITVKKETLEKLEAMIKHLIGEVKATRKQTVTPEVLAEALGKFADILPKAIERSKGGELN